MLSRNQLLERIHHDEPIVRDYKDLKKQLQQCGVDIRVNRIWKNPDSRAPIVSSLDDRIPVIDFDNKRRHTPEGEEMVPTLNELDEEWWYLPAGPYLFQSIEKVWIPNDLCAISSVRSTLMRNRIVTTDSPLFDPGYLGPDNTSLIIPWPGIKIMRGARYTQMVFFELSSPVAEDDLYSGVYNERKE